MGRYFGREPHYSQQEAEAQAKEVIDAAVKSGRPPAEDWNALGSRMGDINRELATRPPVDIPPPPPRRREPEGRPRVVSNILRPQPAPAPEPAPPAKRATRAAAPAAAPAKRTTRAAAPAAAPAKRTTRAAPAERAAGAAPSPEPPAKRPPAKRPAAKKRPG